MYEPVDIVGRTLGDFVLCEKLGAGSYGAVYRAEQQLLDREVAIKVLHSPRRDGGSGALLKEARLATRLDHPYAAHVYGCGVEPDGLLWIAMELVRGTTLARLVAREGALPVALFAPLFERICEVVHTAHAQGVIHCDLKPANVMVVERAGRLLPKLLDFGVARLAHDVQAVSLAGGSVGEGTSPLFSTSTLGLVGTPAYLAPELWRSGLPDARSDQYALAIVAYEALVGRHPFDGRTPAEMGAAHERQLLPALGPAFPSGLDAALARAAAKDPAARWPSALELAAALRDACGPSVEGIRAPELDAELRAKVLVAFPRPIAEAVLQLASTRTTEEASAAVWGVVGAIVRLAGVVALAGDPDGTAAGALLAVLARRVPDEEEWAALARPLCAGHPVAELGGLLDDGALAALFAARRRAAGVEETLPLLEALLTRCQFWSSYPIVVGRAGGVESWTGVGAPRAAPDVHGGAIPVGEVAVVHGGRLVATLAPFARAASPAPGEPEALFLAAGTGRRGALLIAPPGGFEITDAALGAFLLRRMGGSAPAVADPAAPYRGLAAFTSDDADRFFGRELEAEACANRLRVQRLLAIVGPSGAGKTSFVQAGILPALPPTWRTRTLRPGSAPVAALAEALAERLDLLIVDQLEELFTHCRVAAERVAFARSLVAEGGPRLVVILRDDFLIRAEGLPGLRQRLGRGLYILATPARDELLRTVVEPARRTDYEFDDSELPARMVAEVEDRPGALALLSFTAAQLWQRRDVEARRLTRASYDELGGVAGALAAHGEAVFAAVPEAEQRLVREAFRHLITAEGTRDTLSRRELEDVLGGGPAAARTIERLLGARLLSGRTTRAGEQIEVIHEALLSAWPRLAEWRRTDAEGVRLRDQLRSAARQWEERARQSGLLWRGDALTEYRLWRAHWSGALTASEEAFAGASMGEAARGRRTRRFLVGGSLAALAVLAGILFTLWAQAQRSAAEARRRVAEGNLETGRQALLAGDPMRALVFLDAANTAGMDGVDTRFMLARALRPLEREVVALDHGGTDFSMAFDAAGTRVATAGLDGKVRLWDLRGKLEATLVGHSAQVRNIEFSPDGRRLLTGSRDRTARIWEVDGGRELVRLSGHTDDVTEAAFTPDGERVVTAARDRTARIWVARTGAALHVLSGHTEGITALAVSPDGRQVATGSFDKTVRIWDVENGSLVAVGTGHEDVLESLAFSPDGARVLSGGSDGTARVFDAATGATLATLAGHRGSVLDAEWSHDGQRVVTASADMTARLWDARSFAMTAQLGAGDGGLLTATFSPDDRHVVTAGESGGARVWNSATGRLVARVIAAQQSAVRLVKYAPDGSRLATVAASGVQLWDPRADDELAVLAGHGDTVYAVDFVAPDRVITRSLDRSIRAWLIPGGGATVLARDRLTLLPNQENASRSALSRDGRRVLTLEGGQAVVWDLERDAPIARFDAGTKPLDGAAFSADGESVFFADRGGTVRAVSAADATLRCSFRAHAGRVWRIAAASNGRLATVGYADNQVRVWTAGGGALLYLQEPARVAAVAFSPDGARLALASYRGGVKIVDAVTGARRASLEGHSAFVLSLSFSPDGRLVATASADGTAKVWDSATGMLLYSFTGGDGMMTDVAFSPDGTRLVGAGEDKAARVWDVSRERRGPAEVAAAVRCLVPFALTGTLLTRVAIDTSRCPPRRPE